MTAASRLPAAKGNAPAAVNAALRAVASGAPPTGVPQLSLLAIVLPDESTTENVGSARAPGTPRGVSAGPAARMRRVLWPEPGPMVMPGIMMLPLVPTTPRVERLVRRAVPDVAPTS